MFSCHRTCVAESRVGTDIRRTVQGKATSVPPSMKWCRPRARPGSGTGRTAKRSLVPNPRVWIASVAPPQSLTQKLTGRKPKSNSTTHPWNLQDLTTLRDVLQRGNSTEAIVLCTPSEGIEDNTPRMNAYVPETKISPPLTHYCKKM